MPAWRGWGRVRVNRRGHFWGLQMSSGVIHPSVPAEWNMPRAVTTFLHQGLVEFPASTRVNSSPAIFTVILQTGNISTEKWSEFPPTTGPLTFITQLVIQDIWLNLHLQWGDKKGVGMSEPCASTLLSCASAYLCQCVKREGAVMHLLKWRHPFQQKMLISIVLHACLSY